MILKCGGAWRLDQTRQKGEDRMKIDRLIGILAVLLQKEQVTAPCLAEKFEVSRRTISRDIESLCKAGIPIVTKQGAGGGISIMDGYRVDRTLLTSSDMQAILAGIRSLDSVSKTKRYQQLMEKLTVGNMSVLGSNNQIRIDLASYYKSSLAPKVELIQGAIDQQEKISFVYFSPKGESRRLVSPYQLIFYWSSWYVWGFCYDRQSFRLFKLNRMTEVKNTREKCRHQKMPTPDLSSENVFPAVLSAKVLFEPSVKWRLIDEYGKDSFVEQEDGTLLFSFGFSDRDGLYRWLLSFGSQAKLLEPEKLQKDFQKFVQEILKRYTC